MGVFFLFVFCILKIQSHNIIIRHTQTDSDQSNEEFWQFYRAQFVLNCVIFYII